MAYIHRLIVLLFLSFLSLNSFALIPLVPTIKYRVERFDIWHFDRESACSFYFSNKYDGYMFGSTAVQWEFIGVIQENGYIACSMRWRSSTAGWQPPQKYGFSAQQFNSCPINSLPSGSQCVCSPGYEEKDGNSCVLPEPPEEPDPCDGLEDFCKKVQGHEFEWETNKKINQDRTVCYKPSSVLVGLGGGVKQRFPGCNRGCSLQGGSYGIVEYTGSDGTESKVYSGSGNATGSTCGDNEPPKEGEPPKEEVNEVESNGKNECPKGYFPGKVTVNGLENKVCIPPKSKENTFAREMIDNMDGTKTQKESTVKCEAGVCIVTTSTTVYDEDGVEINRGETDRYVSEKDFCREQPNTAVCDTSEKVVNPGEKPGEDGEDWVGPGAQIPGNGQGDGESGEGKGGTFEGSCDSGFTCTGDAIQCSIAKSQHQDSCKLFAPAPAGSVPDGTEEGSAQDLQNNAHVINVQTDLDYSGLGWNRSCPADEDFDIGIAGAKMTIPYSKLCVVLSPMSDITLAITALGLLVWLVAGKKEA